MKILGIIPARYASSRFPKKALVDIHGKSMIQRVYEQAKQADILSDVIIATDHDSIFKHAHSFNGKVVMTSTHHPSGTDRCAEVISNLTDRFDFIINIQGDEPFIQPAQINRLGKALEQHIELATLAIPLEDVDSLFSPHVVKVIFNKKKEAIYFSRHAIPYIRNEEQKKWLTSFLFHKHIGIYAYRSDILTQVTQLPSSSLEKAESLEQLRWIEHGFKIQVITTDIDSYGIDTPEDLEIVKNRFSQ